MLKKMESEKQYKATENINVFQWNIKLKKNELRIRKERICELKIFVIRFC